MTKDIIENASNPMLSARKSFSKKTIHFTMMIVGQSGLGKATFINTLFDSIVIPPREDAEIDLDLERIEPVRFVPYLYESDQSSKKLNITIIDTPGFGESLSNSQGCATILEYIEEQYDKFLAEESRINRIRKYEDSRVHVLLYFIAPTGHGLKDLDILLMKSVGKRVNIIPVIAKSDALTRSELLSFKQQVISDIKKYHIPIYEFEPHDFDESDVIQFKENAKQYLPFAIVGAEPEYIGISKSNGIRRGRQLPWGFVETDNPEHSDFPKLKAILLGQFMEELKENISDILYETYRTEKLSRQEFKELPADSDDIKAKMISSAKKLAKFYIQENKVAIDEEIN